MTKWILLLILFCLHSKILISQGENNIWYFSTGLGLDFNSGSPVPLYDGKINRFREGVATVSDSNGQLLFYSDGIKIWDRTQQVMANGSGLRGHHSSTQSVLITPFPDNNRLFYVFTVSEALSSPGNLYYSVVDMNLNFGKGAVVFSQKNIFLATNLTEKLTSTKGFCGEIWIAVHERNNNKFLIYKLTNAGISGPYISETGHVLTVPDDPSSGEPTSSIGQMKFSPDNTKLALACNTGIFEMFDFNRRTGKVSNPIFLGTDTVENRIMLTYSLSFSPNSQILYVREGGYIPSLDKYIKTIFQYNIQSLDLNGIRNSKTQILTSDTNVGSIIDLQLGPDSVIYVSRKFTNYMSAILNPNEPGLACSFVDTALIFMGSDTMFYSSNLQNLVVVADPIPNIPASFLGKDTILCNGQTLDIDINQQNATFLWNDETIESSISIYESGDYWLEMDISGCLFYDTIQVQFEELYEDLIQDTFLCSDQDLILNLLEGEGLWQDGSTSDSFDVSDAGIYWVEIVDQEGCIIRDTIIVQEADGNILDLGQDTTLCDDLQFLISLPGGYNYEWQDGQTNEEYLITDSGIYWVEVQDGFGCIDRDSIEVNFSSLQKPDLGSDTFICPGDTLILASTVFADSYLWNTSAQNDEIIITEPGEYWLQIEKEGCTTSDTIQIFGDPVPFDLGNDTTICKGEELNLILPAEATYIWQDGRQGFEYQISQAGIYWVESQTGCKLRDSIQVHVLELKADIISTDSVICNGEPVLLAIDDPDISYNWNTGSQEYYIIAQSPGLYSVIIEKVGCTAVDSIWISESNFTLDLGRDTSLCSEDVLVLDTSIPDASYLWQDGSISPTLEVNQSGTYWVDVNLNGCIVRDSILIEKNTFFIDLGKDSIICQGENVLLDVSIPGASYQWDDGSNLPAMTIDQAGTYWVDVSLNGCIQSDTIEIIVNNVEVNLGEDLLVCDGEYVEIDASVSEATFLWQDGSTEATMYTDLPGTYWVEVIKDGCIDSDTIRIEQVVFNLNLGRDTILCPGDEVLLIASVENATYLWQDGSTLSTFNATQPGMYWVDINVDGCVKTDIIEIQNSELCGDSNVFIPNAFSPNRDGVNDEFKVFSKSELLEFSLMIFDRWGNTVFDTNNQEYYWDGKWNGKASATGVYVVFLSFKDPENVNPITITNTLTLIR